MTTGLNDRQMEMLKHLRRLPARYRLRGIANAPLRLEVLDSYDWRTLRALFARNLLAFKDRDGVIVR